MTPSSSVFCASLQIRLDTGPDICDITEELEQLVKKSKMAFGHLSACIIGSTGSITTIEYEPGVVEDLRRAVERMAPPGDDYAHEEAWHDGN